MNPAADAQYITLAKSSQEFQSYLDGTFSNDFVAIPVQSLNVSLPSETVTFRLIKRSLVKKPILPIFLLKTLKIRNFLWLLFPMFIVLWRASMENLVRAPFGLVFSTLSLIFLFQGMNLRNDYSDHIKGYDRLSSLAGSQAIQKAWVRAIDVKRWSWLFIAIAVLLSIPVFLILPYCLIYVVIAVSIMTWAQFYEKGGFNYRVGGELSVFLLMGPLLTSGYEYSMSGIVRFDTIAFGALWGAMVLFTLHLKNLQNILVLSQAGWNNTITRLGFDRSLRLIKWWWIGLLIGFYLYQERYGGYFWSWYLTLFLGFVSLPFLMRLSDVKSPVGSQLLRLRRRGHYLLLTMIGCLLFEHVWYTILALRD